MSKTSESSTQLPLVDFLNTLPSPLTTALVGLAPYISRVRHVAQILSWKSSWEESWIALALWWSVCLLTEIGLRYILPLATLLVLVAARSTSRPDAVPMLVTEDTLQLTISDLTTINVLLPSFAAPLRFSSSIPPSTVLLRVAALLYIPYLLLTHFVRLRVLLALTGTVLLTWRARWAALIRQGLWRSAYIRWAVYRSWALLSGQPLGPKALSAISAPSRATTASTTAVPSPSSPQPAEAVRFLFTVCENQRWWMGLDWTAALLPGERPSWCSAALHPVAPPATFSLPAPRTVYMPGPNGTRVKRTARWRWAEPEWRVMVHREGEVAARMERPLPKEEVPGTASSSAARMLRAAGKMREGSVSMGGVSPERSKEKDKEEGEGKGAGAEEEGKQEDMFTDADGWVYADNKWEGASAKGGMGKYTRYRRWTRIAILIETADPVGPGEMGIQHDNEEQDSKVPSTATSPLPVISPPDWEPAHGRSDSLDKKPLSAGSLGDEDRLKRRLKAAVQHAGPA